MKQIALWLLALLVVAAPPERAGSFYLLPDVPTDLAGETHLPWSIVRHDSESYGSEALLPAGTPVVALHRMNRGDWLLAVEAPRDVDGTTYEPRDVIRFDGATYALFFDGSALGVPTGSGIDSVFLDGGDTGDLVIGFDTPTTIGQVTYQPADLVRFSGAGFSLYFDASAAGPGIPASADVTGADLRDDLLLLTFDVPTTLGGTTHLPGDVVSWDSEVFAPFNVDPSWPISSRMNGLACLASPGRLEASLRLGKSTLTPGDLTLNWLPSCAAGADDYAIYEGAIGVWYGHTQIDCADAGSDLAEEITPATGDRYYLIVPWNPDDEGSYGTDSFGMERPRGSATCVATQELAACPSPG